MADKRRDTDDTLNEAEERLSKIELPAAKPKKPPYKPNYSPPPERVPPSVGEQRALAEAKVALQEERERRHAAEKKVRDEEDRRRMAEELAEREVMKGRGGLDLKGLAVLITAIGGIGIGSWAKVESAEKKDKVDAHGVLIQDEAKQSAETAEWRARFVKYAEALERHYDCRLSQTSSAVERSAGYDFGFKIENVRWQSVCLQRPGRVCKGPAYRAEDECPEKPKIPQ